MSAALVIHPNGRVIKTKLSPGGDHLALMRRHLDCRLVDCVSLTDRMDMWIDDEGLQARPVNPAATVLARRYGLMWQHYHGPVLVCGVNARGDSVDLTNEQVDGLLAHLTDVANAL